MIGRQSTSARLAPREAMSREAAVRSDLAPGPPALAREPRVSVRVRRALAQEHRASVPEHPGLEPARQDLVLGHRDLALVRQASVPVRERVRERVKLVSKPRTLASVHPET